MKDSELKKLCPSGVEYSYARNRGTFKIVPGKTKTTKFLKVISQAVKLKTPE